MYQGDKKMYCSQEWQLCWLQRSGFVINYLILPYCCQKFMWQHSPVQMWSHYSPELRPKLVPDRQQIRHYFLASFKFVRSDLGSILLRNRVFKCFNTLFFLNYLFGRIMGFGSKICSIIWSHTINFIFL